MRKIESQAFNNLSNLTYLDLSYNKLPTLELNDMCHLPKLQTLNISGNVQLNLFEMSAVFQNMSELRSLSIGDITNLPSDIFDTLNKLQSLNISGAGLGSNVSRILQSMIMLKVCMSLFKEFQRFFQFEKHMPHSHMADLNIFNFLPDVKLFPSICLRNFFSKS